MKQIHDTQYQKFTPIERAQLTFAALSRGDEPEATRLWQTCPRHTYKTLDVEYTLRVNTLIMLGSMFFEKCIKHYNLIKKADMFIMSSEQDLDCEELAGLEHLANQTRELIELVSKAQKAHISRLKSLYEGFRLFCSNIDINSECVLNTIPIKDCCYDLDILLASDTEIDVEYRNQIKDFFLKYWQF